MIPTNFEYHRAGSVKEAVDMLEKYGDEAKILAGGHSLVPTMKLRLATPEHLIDIRHIEGLNTIKQEGEKIVIGANCTHAQVIADALVAQHLPILVEAGSLIGDIQVRNRGTIGGSVAHADPAADWPAVMLAVNARFVLQGPNGKRTVDADDFFQGIYTTALEENEVMTEIRIQIPSAGTRSSYMKFMQPASRFAIVGCAVMMNRKQDGAGPCHNVRVAFNGVAGAAFRDSGIEGDLEGNMPDASTIAAAVAKAAEGKNIMSDHFASKDYRQHLARVYAQRALNATV